MSINNHKVVLILGACDKKHRMNSYVIRTSNATNIQIIDVTKDVEALKTCDQSYVDYIDETISFFIGDEIEKVDAVIFYSTERHVYNAVIKKLNPQCLVINHSEINMTERELIEQISCYDEKLKMESEDGSNPVFLKSVQDLQSVLTNAQVLSQGFVGFFVEKKARVTLSESENRYDIRWSV